MNGVRDTERGRLLGKTFILISLPHCEAPRLLRPIAGNKKLCSPVDVAVAWTWARSDEAEHALDCSPVITRGMIVSEMCVDRLSCCRLPGLGRPTLPKEIPRLLVSRNVHD